MPRPGILFQFKFLFSVLLLVFVSKLEATTVSKVEFQTDEGTWISLDISPDGKTILFELLGDIYRIPATGGAAEALISGSSFDSQARFSPDGSQIVFVSDRSGEDNIWLADSNGRVLSQISEEISAEMFSPAFSADGKHILVSRISPRRSPSKPVELWRYSIDDEKTRSEVLVDASSAGQLSALISSIPTGAFGAVASPDGRFIYFSSPTPRESSALIGPNSQIMRYDLERGISEPVTFRREGAFKPVVSPDGRWLAFGALHSGTTGLRIRNIETGDERWLLKRMQHNALEDRATRDILPNFVFTPDSKNLIIAYDGKIHRVDISSGQDEVVPFTANVSLDITPRLEKQVSLADGPVRARVVQGAELSPDGKTLVFSAFGKLYVMPVAGGTPQRLTRTENMGEFHPAWSADGQFLVYVTWDALKGGHVWKVRNDGNQAPQKLTHNPAFYRNPVWAADGEMILAITAPREIRLVNDNLQLSMAEQIIRLPSGGGQAQTIAPANGASRLQFSSHTDRFYSYSRATGLISRNLDGNDLRLHLRIEGFSPTAGPAVFLDALMSPDGTQALARVSAQLYVIQMKDVPDEQPLVNVYATAPGVSRLTTIGADHYSWAQGGETISWTAGATIYIKSGASERVREVEAVVEKARRIPSGSVLLRGANTITMVGNNVIENADVLITRNRISALGSRGTVEIPRKTKIIDVSGKTLMPGIVDIHAHWETKKSVLDTQDYNAYANLAFGVTSIREPQSFDADIFVYSDLAAAGEMVSPRIYSTGMGVFWMNHFKSYEEVLNTLSRYSDKYQTHLLKSYLVGNRQTRQWVVRACRELGLMATAEGGADTKLDLTHAMDGFSGTEHSVPTTPLYRDVIQLFAETGISYTPTFLVAFGGPEGKFSFASREDVSKNNKLLRFVPTTIIHRQTAEAIPWSRPEDQVFPQMAEDVNRLMKAGGRIGLGGHGELQGLGVHWEMWSLASGGMRAHDVLRVATLESAHAIGLSSELGSIEVGKAADILVLDKNPLLDIRNTDTVSLVMVNGILYEADSLNEIWPLKTPLPETWWLSDSQAY